jgi:glycosyltransferase involved in cell wall biosynthesis
MQARDATILENAGPTKILHVVATLNAGGIETFLVNIHRKIDRNIIEFDYLVHTPTTGKLEPEIIRLGGRIHRLPYPIAPSKLIKFRLKLREFLVHHHEYGIVHLHLNAFNGIYANAIKNIDRRTCIAHCHTASAGGVARGPAWWLARCLGTKAIDYRFACSRQAAIWGFGTASDSATILVNGLEIGRYEFSPALREKFRSEHGLEGKFVIGHVGRFAPDKNHPFILETFKQVLQRRPAVLVLVGAGAMRSELERRVREEKIENVIFVGHKENVCEALSAMDCFLFPSLAEGLGNAVVEAQISGLQCFVSERVPREVAVSDRLSVLDLSDGPGKWAEAIVNGKYHGARESAGFLNQSIKSFDIDRQVGFLQDFYRKISPTGAERV